MNRLRRRPAAPPADYGPAPRQNWIETTVDPTRPPMRAVIRPPEPPPERAGGAVEWVCGFPAEQVTYTPPTAGAAPERFVAGEAQPLELVHAADQLEAQAAETGSPSLRMRAVLAQRRRHVPRGARLDE